MRAHIVLAHPERNSFNASLTEIASETLRARGWSVTVNDLYASGFDPCERFSHYADPLNGARFDVQSEQRHASIEGTIPSEVEEEIANLAAADLLIIQYPMWWHLPPMFNPQNFFGKTENVYGRISSKNVICAPAERKFNVQGLRKVTGPEDHPSKWGK